jgi:hypothetical protein
MTPLLDVEHHFPLEVIGANMAVAADTKGMVE